MPTFLKRLQFFNIRGLKIKPDSASFRWCKRSPRAISRIVVFLARSPTPNAGFFRPVLADPQQFTLSPLSQFPGRLGSIIGLGWAIETLQSSQCHISHFKVSYR